MERFAYCMWWFFSRVGWSAVAKAFLSSANRYYFQQVCENRELQRKAGREKWAETAVEKARSKVQTVADWSCRSDAAGILKRFVGLRDLIVSKRPDGNAALIVAERAMKTGKLDLDARGSEYASELMVGAFAEQMLAAWALEEIDNATAQATGPSRRQGRL